MKVGDDMDWWLFILFFFGLFLLLLFMGIPVAFSFLLSNFIIISIIIGFDIGIRALVKSMYSSITSFSLTAIPLFVLIGELLFISGVALRTLDVFNSWFRRLPGNLSILSIVSGTAFASLSGSAIANTSMLGTVLVPEMRKQGYHYLMSVGPIMAGGSLAMIIPPSAMAVLFGGIASVSVGPLLLGGVIPGLILAVLYLAYIIVSCRLQPSMVPKSGDDQIWSWRTVIRSFLIDVLPLSVIVFGIIGFIFLGVATPTESAAIGCVAALLIVLFKGKLNYSVIKKSIEGTLKISGMIFLIVAAAQGFAQLLSFTGASRGLVGFITGFDFGLITLVVIFLLMVFLLGFFVEPISVMMITVPLFVPILTNLEVDLVWFGIMMLICLGLGNITPPVGMLLFVMKGVVPEMEMKDIYKSVVPYILIQFVLLFLILMIPSIVLWLPMLAK
jgi:tripartite ATP-independent transporter DctM subunit